MVVVLFWLLFHVVALKCSQLLNSATDKQQIVRGPRLSDILQTQIIGKQTSVLSFLFYPFTPFLVIIIIILLIMRLCVRACVRAHLSCLTPTCLPATSRHCFACHLSASHLLLLAWRANVMLFQVSYIIYTIILLVCMSNLLCFSY